MSDGIEKTLNSVRFDSEIFMNNHNQFCSIRLFNFEDIGYSGYIRFRVGLKDSFFHVLIDCEMGMGEFLCFKEELILLTQGQIQEISLSPLGEFIRFSIVSISMIQPERIFHYTSSFHRPAPVGRIFNKYQMHFQQAPDAYPALVGNNFLYRR